MANFYFYFLFFMQQQKLIQNHDKFPCTHYFIYKNKKFPINFDFFKNSSEIFANNLIDIDGNQNIQLIDDELKEYFELSEESIQNFVNYVHRQDIFLNNDNVMGINYLATKYKIISLKQATEEYINDNHREMLLPNLLIHQNDLLFDTSSFETILSENLEEYINDGRLLDLNIPILFRILEKYSKSEKAKNGFNQNIMDFLFKCLDKYKRNASVLFSFINIEKIQLYLKRLLTDYSNLFDFHFINSSLLNVVYENQNEMILKEQQMQMEQVEFMKSVNDQLIQLKGELTNMKNLNEKLIDDQKKNEEQYSNDIKSMKDEIEKLKTLYNDQINTNKQKEEENIKEIKALKDEIKKFKNFFVAIPYSEQNINGILQYLKQNSNINDQINITSSSQQKGSLQNLLKFSDGGDFYTLDEPDSWICIEFKKYKIKPTSYTLKSHNNSPGGCQPKNWVIEGSIDNQHWIKIDEQSNCSYLNGNKIVHTFPIQYNNDESFKSLRIRQTGPNWCDSDGWRNILALYSIEFYGILNI